MKPIFKIIGATLALALSNSAALSAVSAKDENLTTVGKLRNDMPLIERETEGSDIVSLSVTFLTGSADESFNRRAINQLAFESMGYASKTFPKQKIFSLTEKYSIGLECRGGVEISRCTAETIRDYLPLAIDLLASIVTEPKFNREDVELAKQQRVADFQGDIQNPESQVNSVVNGIFYDQHHPYRLLPQDGIKQTQALTAEDLKTYHSSKLDAANMFVTYAGPKLTSQNRAKLEAKFGKIGKSNKPRKIVSAPVFDPKSDFSFEHRQIPTAYIRMKFNAPSVLAKDAVAADIMLEILSEKLQEEVRTKRSLSYAVYAQTIQYNQGIGVISASTSKPQETLEAIASVVKSLKDHGVSQEELDEYRNVFATGYFLTLESHGSLAGALSSFQAYFGDARRLYDLPHKMANVTPADIQRLAKEVLKNFRVGVIYDKEKFNAKWIEPLRKA